MALLAPVAFAVGGSLLTGGATWGMAAGWLIGSWLFGPKAENDNKIFDPGEEEIPSFNQALRGSTMPILFGTNRISSQVVWTKNWTVIRKESGSGGGGKSGGSGMGGKQGSQQGEVTYEYKWDLMFHIGMSDQNLDLLGGWLISERINDETIGAILAGADSQWATFNGLIQAASEADSVWDSAAIGAQYESGEIGADFDFEDSYYHGAGSTDGTFDNWAHFESEEGGPYRWPYTCYVGFKQFNLGSTARVPQITWEVGEGGIDLTGNGLTAAPSTVNQSDTNANFLRNGAFLRARDGTLFQMDVPRIGTNNQSSVLPRTIYKVGTNDSYTFVADGTEYANDMVAKMPSWSAGSTILWGATTIDDRYYLLLRMYYNVNLDWRTEGSIYEITDSTGAYAHVGAFALPGPFSITQGQYVTRGTYIGIANAGTDDDPIVMMGARQPSGFGREMYLYTIPSINQMKDGFYQTDAQTNYWEGTTNRHYEIQDLCPDFDYEFYNDGDGSYQNGNSPVLNTWVMPVATIGLLGVSYTNNIWRWVNRATAQWFVDDNVGAGGGRSTFMETHSDANPDGFIIKMEMVTIGSDGELTITGGNDYTIAANDAAVQFSWPNVNGQYDDTGTTYEEDTDWSCMCMRRLTSGFGAGGILLLNAKLSDIPADEALVGDLPYARVSVSFYNPLTEVVTEYANVRGAWTSDYTDFDNAVATISAATVGTDFWYRRMYVYYDAVGARVLIQSRVQTNQFGDSEYQAFGEFGGLVISGGTDITPPTIIYRILTSPVYGLGISTDDIDNASYIASDLYCQNENILVSAQYRREEGALAVITQLLELYGGFLIDSGGKIKFGLQEFSTSTVRTIDNDHLRIDQEGEPPVLITKGARQDTYNRVKVNYFDRSLDYRQNFIEVSDEVDMDINGVRAQEFPAKFVMSETTARKMAVRALWGNLYARDIYDFKLGAKDADLEPGDVITLVDSYHTELQSGKQARIVTWQETEPLTFQVKAVEEVEYINDSTLAPDDVTEATKNVLNIRPKPMAEFGMYELPDEYQGADAQLFVGYRQQSPIMGARLYVSADGVTYGLAGDTQPYVISGIFLDGLPSRNPGYVEENVEVYLIPDTTVSGGFNTTTPYFAQKHTLDDVNASGRASGLGNIWAGSEMLAFEGVNLVAQNWYRFDKLYRGWGGTHIQDHSSGDTWWKQAAGIFTQGINQDKIGTLIYYKVTGYNFNGVEYNLSSVDARTYQILGTYWRPQVQAPIATYVQSPSSYLTIQSEDLGYIQKKQVVAGGSPVQFEWSQSAREAGYGAAGYGLSGYGRFTQDTTSVSYRVEVLSNDLSTVVRCTTVNTTAYLYTTNLNSEDWTGWNGSFAVRVTPFNPYGTALRSRTKILELFE
jgi:hypothetical protein